jgi:hypothetical protein
MERKIHPFHLYCECKSPMGPVLVGTDGANAALDMANANKTTTLKAYHRLSLLSLSLWTLGAHLSRM